MYGKPQSANSSLPLENFKSGRNRNSHQSKFEKHERVSNTIKVTSMWLNQVHGKSEILNLNYGYLPLCCEIFIYLCIYLFIAFLQSTQDTSRE
jgi:hypothetical protein